MQPLLMQFNGNFWRVLAWAMSAFRARLLFELDAALAILGSMLPFATKLPGVRLGPSLPGDCVRSAEHAAIDLRSVGSPKCMMLRLARMAALISVSDDVRKDNSQRLNDLCKASMQASSKTKILTHFYLHHVFHQ